MSEVGNSSRSEIDQDILFLRNTLKDDENDLAIANVFLRFRPQLLRIVEFRMDARIRSRVDANDILQETFLNVKQRYRNFIEEPGVSLFVWIRQLTLQVLIEFQRRHFRQKRDVQKEVRISPTVDQSDTSQLIARELAAQLTSPSQVAIRAEELEQLNRALESMNETDREILALRHYEQLSNQEVAEIIGIKPTAASNRYVRAITKLGEVMESFEK